MAIRSKRGGLVDVVYEHVKNGLLNHEFHGGGWLPVDKIAADLEVSRQPVMDALKRLALEGFVTIVPQVGCRVRQYSAEEISDFYQLFAFGESLVAELAAKRVSAEDIIKLRVISEQIGMLSKSKGQKQDLASQYRSLNRMLHSEIRRIARSASVTEIVESLGDRSDFFIATSGRPMFAETLRKAHDEHEAVLDAIIRRNSVAAARAMHAHISETGRRLNAFLNSVDDGGGHKPANFARSKVA